MKKKNEYDLPLEPGKNQIQQKGRMKGHLKYSLLEKVCKSQLECIKDYQSSMDNLVTHMDFVMKQNEEIWKERNDAVRAYNGMILSKQTAEQMGIDTDAMATPEQKESKADSALLHVFKKNSINVARTSSHDVVESKTPAQ